MGPSGSESADKQPVMLHLVDVGFRYQEEWIIRGMNLQLDLAVNTSLIGTVGSGKSTLLKLICAEVKPTEGTIRVEFDNGECLDLWHSDVYRQFRKVLGYMPQEAYLSNTSLAINVSLDANYKRDDVMQAVRLAELEADIHLWEGGIDEEVGEIGVNLSGGQKQRVSLARALYSRRAYLVLDDPLSAVDAGTEEALMKSLLAVSGGFLLASHRLTELRHTDRLLVMESGRIIEDGNPVLLAEDATSKFSQQLRAGERYCA